MSDKAFQGVADPRSRAGLVSFGDTVTALSKLAVAKAQLITALDLFVRSRDPISVHCLACGGGEIIEGLAEVSNAGIFRTHILTTQPGIDRRKIRRLRNSYWNAFKHFYDLKGARREDEELLTNFSDDLNDAALFIGWWDYAALTGKLPVSAQVFQAWWYALNEDKINPDFDLSAIIHVFPGIKKHARSEQKRRLRRSIEKYRKNVELLADPLTEAEQSG